LWPVSPARRHRGRRAIPTTTTENAMKEANHAATDQKRSGTGSSGQSSTHT
jgi:hypothetical protein